MDDLVGDLRDFGCASNVLSAAEERFLRSLQP
jgi:hypothetical protein